MMAECRHSHGMCHELAEKLLQFRDGTLPEADVQHLREHLRYCPPCLDLLNSYDEVIDVLHRLQPVGMPPGLMERVRAAMQRELAAPGGTEGEPEGE